MAGEGAQDGEWGGGQREILNPQALDTFVLRVGGERHWPRLDRAELGPGCCVSLISKITRAYWKEAGGHERV